MLWRERYSALYSDEARCDSCLQVYGATYLQKLLEPLLRAVITTPEWQHVSFEVDPTRLYFQNRTNPFVLLHVQYTSSE